MVQGRRGAGFLLEAAHAIGIFRKSGRQHLDGDVASEPRVTRAIDLAHAAGADGCEDFVRSEPSAGLD